MIDDLDMRVGFAIDKLFRSRPHVVKRCITVGCDTPIGSGSSNRLYCTACASQRAIKGKTTARPNYVNVELARAKIRRDLLRQQRRALRPGELVGQDGGKEEPASRAKAKAKPAREPDPVGLAKIRRDVRRQVRRTIGRVQPASHPWKRT